MSSRTGSASAPGPRSSPVTGPGPTGRLSARPCLPLCSAGTAGTYGTSRARPPRRKPPRSRRASAETTRERWQRVHDLRGKGVGLLDCSRRRGLSLNTVKRYDRADAPGRLRRAARYRPTLVDPYRDYPRKRRADEPGVPVQQLLREIRERGYPGSSNLLVRYPNQGRADAERPHLAPRKATQILPTRPENLTDGQRETAARPASACPEMTALATLIGSFAALLDPGPGNEDKLLQWTAGARAAGLPHLHSFTRGPGLDIKAAAAAVTLPHHNGRTEGVNNKTILWNQDCQIGPA
jgi:hypothetical protein